MSGQFLPVRADTADAVHAHSAAREIIIHVRFHPNGLINTIKHRPAHLDPQEWFDRLCLAARTTYQPLAGGRGVLRLQGDIFDRLWQEATAD